MKYKSVSTIAAILCGTVLAFAASLTSCAQTGVKTAEFELNPPADAENAGRFRFSFATGEMEWIPIRRISSLQDLAEASAQQNQEKGSAELDFSMMGEIDMRKVEIMVLSESEIKSILSTGILPEKDATKNPRRMNPDSHYVLKDESEYSFYVFKLKDHSSKYAWQQIAYVRIGEGESWKGNPDLAALLDEPKADAASNSRRKTNADKTRQKIQQAWDRQEAERKNEEERVRQERREEELNRKIEAAQQNPTDDTFPKTPEEIKLVDDLIRRAEYDKLLEICEGKKLDFNVNSATDNKVPLLYQAIEQSPQYRNQSFLERKNKVFEFVLNNGGAAVIPTEKGVSCVEAAARTNNKTVFDLLMKNGFDLNQKNRIGKTVLEFLVEQNIKVDPEIMNELKATTKPSLFSMVLERNADGLKKALENEENLAAINKPIPPLDGAVAGKTLLEYAIDHRNSPNTEIVKTLLDAGAKFKDKDISGLMLSKQENLIPLFWKYRDRMSGEDWDKCFNYAALYRNTDAFKFFLEKGLDPEKPENSVSTRTPRFNAYLQGTPEMVDMLEARGFKKPFWAAIRWNDLELVKEYLAAGADVNEADKVSRSKPIMHALSGSHQEMAELLLEHGVKVSPDDYRRAGEHYPVEIAAHGGQTKIMELLLKHGFVPDFPKTPGDTKHPYESSGLYMALSYKNYETAKVLLKYGARTDLTMNEVVWDKSAKKRVKKEVTLEEHFSFDPEALKVLGARPEEEKGFFDFR